MVDDDYDGYIDLMIDCIYDLIVTVEEPLVPQRKF